MRQLKITKQVTNRETASLDKYLQEIGKVDLITADEEVELAQRIKAGDQLALEKLTKANLRFVVSVAKQYQNQGLTLPDLINEGNLGLIKAAQRFDETRGFKFISYAVWWIRQSILQALAEQSRIVRLPLNKIGSINKINKTYAFLEQSHERPPSAEEIAKELDMTINDVKESMKNSGRHVSMDAPLVEGEDSNLYDVILKLVKQKSKELKFDEEKLNRQLNVGFSGGEKKKNEILQMSLLEPKLSILDETDSGLDIDALKIVAEGVNTLRDKKNSFLIITHYQRLLDYIKPDFVHVFVDGKIVETGGKELSDKLEKEGYESYQ